MPHYARLPLVLLLTSCTMQEVAIDAARDTGPAMDAGSAPADAAEGGAPNDAGTPNDSATMDDAGADEDASPGDAGPPPPVKAFPLAYGGGAYASGGRGGQVHHVTSLEDDGAEGTLRWALLQPRPATIVFDVSGVIELQSSMTIRGNDLTIAGQSAPEGGITITAPPLNYNFTVGRSQNIIIRYIRSRMQFYGNAAFRVFSDNFEDSEASDLIFDHMSLSYSSIGCIGVRGRETHNITFQNGLIGECGRGGLFGDTDPDHAGFSYDNTFTRTLFYNISHRTPNTSSGRADVYNNVVYNWQYRLTTVATNAHLNHFNNYYFLGNRTALFSSWPGEPDRWYVNAATNNPAHPFEIFSAGNIVEDLFTDPAADNQYLWIMHNPGAQTIRVDSTFFRDTPFPTVGEPAPAMSATEAAAVVPMNAGANRYLNDEGIAGTYRDAADARYVRNTMLNMPEMYNNSGGTDGKHTAFDEAPYADFLASISSTPLATRPDDFYVSNPHIPEPWFRANVPTGEDHNDIAPSGYTWLEEYLNQ